VKRALAEVSIIRPHASRDARELGEALLEVNARHERLVDGLLTLADSENEVTERLAVDLDDVADQVLSAAAGAARQAGVRITPPELGDAPAQGDPYLLERLVQNLVENAIRHNLPDGGSLSVRTGTDAGHATLVVGNTGPVVRRYECEALFQPFRRLGGRAVQARPGTERGFGLGLSIVRAIARAHGGEARAEPRAGGGLVVTVTVPVRDPDPPPERQAAVPR
jgi:signal transduction histidine kinase